MKKLYLLRHAKPAKTEPGEINFNPALSKQGERDAIILAEKLKRLGIAPDLVVASTAERTMATAKTIVDGIAHAGKITAIKELYMADDMQQLVNVVESIDNSFDSALIVAHNPDLTDFVNHFSDKIIDSLSPCSFIALVFPVTSWRKIKSGTISAFFSPDDIDI